MSQTCLYRVTVLVVLFGLGGCADPTILGAPNAGLDATAPEDSGALDTRSAPDASSSADAPDIAPADTSSPSAADGASGSDTAEADVPEADAPEADASDHQGPPGERTIRQVNVSMTSRELVCKLISGKELDFESDNHTHTRFNLRGTDLGTPTIIGDSLHLFFGDTHGYRQIWRVGEDPDSVARVSYSAARADLRELCRNLDFYVTNDIPSVAAHLDSRIQRDFQGGYLTAPAGERIREYIDRPVPFFETETGSFAGSFEVPTGAVTHNGETYIFWSTRPGTGEIGPMRLNFIAHWPHAGVGPLSYQILYKVDSLEELGQGRPLGGHFLQIAPIVRDEYLYIFGTGRYRRDGVHLARKPATDIQTPGGFELFDPRNGTWTPAESLSEAERAGIPAVIDEDVRGIGELGVQYVEDAGLYVMMFQQLSQSSGGNQMGMRVAPSPQGPWGKVNIITMHDPIFAAQHCCVPNMNCDDGRVIRCDKGGLYGIYPLPLIEAREQGEGRWELTVPFVASTWVPYNVVLFRTTVTVELEYD